MGSQTDGVAYTRHFGANGHVSEWFQVAASLLPDGTHKNKRELSSEIGGVV